jgi:predicted glycosyltransferase
MHDFGSKTQDDDDKQAVIEELESFGPVWISSETALPANLEKYRIPLKAGHIHHAIAGARLVMGESATMCTEAAVLGVPSIHIHKNRWGYVKELEERYGLIQHFPDRDDGQKAAVEAAITILKDDRYMEENRVRRQRLLSEKKNMMDLMVKIVEKKMKDIASVTNFK